MSTAVSKAKFKPRALEYFRQVERTGRPLVITDRGRPVLRIVPYGDDGKAALAALRNSVRKYVRPTDPVAADEWEAAK